MKYYFTNDNWFSIRFSGTEPILRLTYETNTEAQAQELRRTIMGDKTLNLPAEEE